LLQGAAAAITVSPTWANALRDRFECANKVHVITNGYDPEEAERVAPHEFDHFAIVYAGRFYPPRRVVTPLMAALSQLKNHKTRWFFHYYGGHQSHVAEEAAKYGLADRVVQHGYLPRAECLSAIRGASVALVLNPVSANATDRDLGWIPAKLFEPLALRAPILFIGATDGDAARIVQETGDSGVFSGQDTSAIVSFLSALMDHKTMTIAGCDAYSWAQLAIKLDRVLREAAGIESPTKRFANANGDRTAQVCPGDNSVPDRLSPVEPEASH
jgi:glycosyltransferase involved in cell wall biosynthesis